MLTYSIFFIFGHFCRLVQSYQVRFGHLSSPYSSGLDVKAFHQPALFLPFNKQSSLVVRYEGFLIPILPILFPTGPGRSTCILRVHPRCPHYLNQLKPGRHDKDKDEDDEEHNEDDNDEDED